MTLFEALGWLAGVASIVGLVYAVASWKRDQAREKRLVFATRGGPPLARSRSLGDYELKVLFKQGGTSEEVTSAFVTYGTLANLGREPIRRVDIAPANPLVLHVAGARVLSMELEKATRAVCQIALADRETVDDAVRYPVSFDFLDKGDGALIRILTDGRPDSVDLLGDVIGMPSGVARAPKYKKKSKVLSYAQVVLNLALFVVPQLFVGIWFVRTVDRPLYLLWLAAPVVLLIVSIILALVLDEAISPTPKPFKFPKVLSPRHDHADWVLHAHMMRGFPDYDFSVAGDREVVSRRPAHGPGPLDLN